MTTTAGNLDDDSPTLAYNGNLDPVLVWTRTVSPAQPGPSDLMVKKRVDGVWEPDRVLASLGRDNGSPDMTILGAHTFVTWRRDGAIIVASKAGGPSTNFTTHRFVTPGFGPKVGATGSGVVGHIPFVIDHVFVTWTTTAGGNRVFFAESATTGNVGGTWDGTLIAPTGTTAFGIGALDTKATAIYGTGTSMASRSQT